MDRQMDREGQKSGGTKMEWCPWLEVQESKTMRGQTKRG